MPTPAKPSPPDSRPRFIETRSSAEFFAMCDHAKAGEFKVFTLTSLATKGGKDNGAWRFEVGYPAEA